MTEFSTFERRRYSGIVFSHPQVQSCRDLSTVMKGVIKREVQLRPSFGDWELQRSAYLHDRSVYPAHLTSPSEREEDGGYRHDFYIGSRAASRVLGGRVLLVASPYVRLLDSFFSALLDRLPAPTPQFLAPRLPEVFEYLAKNPEPLRASRVTVQMDGQVGLELVSLVGRSPLQSDLNRAISTIASPYSVRVDFEGPKGTSRVAIDRHGNYWWYLAAAQLMENVGGVLDCLLERKLLRSRRVVPLRRLSDDA